jgi:V8-like Glu-specific endopeptidase
MIDNRSVVKDILEFPQNIVGYLKVSFYRKFDKKKQLIGSMHSSGTLITSGIVLTCAHNLLPPTEDFDISQENI